MMVPVAHRPGPILAASPLPALAADVVNQYTQVGGVNRTHDSNGNLTDDGTYLFSYDFQNRLVRVTNKGSSQVVADYRFECARTSLGREDVMT